MQGLFSWHDLETDINCHLSFGMNNVAENSCLTVAWRWDILLEVRLLFLSDFFILPDSFSLFSYPGDRHLGKSKFKQVRVNGSIIDFPCGLIFGVNCLFCDAMCLLLKSSAEKIRQGLKWVSWRHGSLK